MRHYAKRLARLELQGAGRANLPAALLRRRRRPHDPESDLSRDDLEVVLWALRVGLDHDTAAALIGDEAGSLQARLARDGGLATACRQAIALGRAHIMVHLHAAATVGNSRAIAACLDERPAGGMLTAPDPRFE